MFLKNSRSLWSADVFVVLPAVSYDADADVRPTRDDSDQPLEKFPAQRFIGLPGYKLTLAVDIVLRVEVGESVSAKKRLPLAFEVWQLINVEHTPSHNSRAFRVALIEIGSEQCHTTLT